MKGFIILIGVVAVLILLVAIIRKSVRKDFLFVKETLRPYRKQLIEYFASHGMNERELYPVSQILGVTREFILESRIDIDRNIKNKLLKTIDWMHEDAKITESNRSVGIFE